jgi:NADH:ubiquinone oxidoreductase subunit 6 (subunit J)
MEIAFGVLCAMIVLACGVIVFSKKLVYTAYALVVVMLAIAGIFLLAHAEFVAVVQMMVYVGGVITLLLFTLFVHNQRISAETTIAPTWLLAIILCLGMGIVMYLFPPIFTTATPTTPTNSLANIGKLLLTTYALPFEIVGILLTMLLCSIGYLFKKPH